MWDGSPFASCPKHNGRAHLREPLIGNARYRSPICKRGRFRLPLRWLRMSARDVWGRSCDLTSLEAVTEAFTQAATDMGGLDTVVNNAGISQRSPLLDYTAEEFAKVMDLNVVAVFNGHQAAAKIMTEAGHGGTITTTSSMVAKYGQPSGVGYPTSKFAVNGMVQSLSRELAPMGIRVNAVAPGVTKTDMVANLPEEVIKPIIATIPLGRMGEPEDVANAFVFLASDMSSYVTGAVLPVDGAARS